MFNHLASLGMSTSILKALPGKLDIKRHSSSILYIAHATRLASMLEYIVDPTWVIMFFLIY